MFKKVGKKNVISSHTLFYVPHGVHISSVIIGSDVRVAENVRVDCASPVTIGNNVWISENVHIMNHEHIIDGKKWKGTKDIRLTKGIVLCDDSWIGAESIILPKVTRIGEGAIIGAGSVVTKDVGDYMIVAGNPAVVIGIRKD